MKIIVFIKQVPDTDDVKLDPKTGNLKRDGVKSTLNASDANSIEAALQLREKYGGTVSVVTMGPPQAAQVLKKALGLGCDEAFLLSDRAFGGADTLATSYTLAKAAEKIGQYDLLLFGQFSSDGDTAQVGPATAAQLGLPQITLASELEYDGKNIHAVRILGEKRQRVRVSTPAAVILRSGINTLRHASVIDIVKAQSKALTVWDSAALECSSSFIGTAGSPSETRRVFEPKRKESHAEFIGGDTVSMAKALADVLEAKHII